MGVPVLIMGESGTGKSTSIRTFLHDDVGIINVMGKPLPFRGNYQTITTRDLREIRAVLPKCKAKAIVIDDFGYTITSIYMRGSYGDAKYRDQYEVYKEIAGEVWAVVNTVTEQCPHDTVVYFIMHTALEGGQIVPSTIGKLLNEKINLVGMFTITMLSYTDGETYGFIVGNNPPAKSPLGMFENDHIDNDLKLVDSTIREYWGLAATKEE